VTPVAGKPPVKIAWSKTLPPIGILAALTVVERLGLAGVTVNAKVVAIEDMCVASPE
jgi:hypothetical protein